MRTYGRINGEWVEVTTDDNGFNDPVYLTTLAQCIKLQPGESPFYSQYGIPATMSVIQQILPSFYTAQLQAQFSPYFASLIVSKTDSATPTYNVNVLTNSGVQNIYTVAI